MIISKNAESLIESCLSQPSPYAVNENGKHSYFRRNTTKSDNADTGYAEDVKFKYHIMSESRAK